MPSWQDQGLCAQADPDAWFPDMGGSTRAAKKVCARCPVKAPCLDYALANREGFGVWGGLSVPERQRLYPEAFAPDPEQHQAAA